MKKTMLKVVGALAMLSALFLAACSNGVVQGDMSGDTLYTLDTPTVTAVAYPGMISASWTEVPDTTGYTVQVLVDGLETKSYTVNGNRIDIDTPLNGIGYTFRVSAISSASPSRAVTVRDSKFGEAKATSIVPPSGISIVQLAAYEGGYDGKEKTLKTTFGADSIRVTKKDNAVYIGFQAKAYLKYYVELDDNFGTTHEFIYLNTPVSTTKNDGWVEVKKNVTTYGDYTVVVYPVMKNSSLDSLYTHEHITLADKVSYTQFAYDLTAASNASAVYFDNIRGVATEEKKAENAVRISWTPAVLEGENAPVNLYKVYRRTAYSNDLVEITKATVYEDDGTTVKEEGIFVKESDLTGETLNTDKYDSNVKYYIDTTVEDATIKYTYIIVLSKDGKFATPVSVALAPKAAGYTTAGTVSGTVTNTKIVDDAVENDIEWTITKDNKYQTFKAYELYKKYSDGLGYTATPIAEDFDTAEGKELTGAVTEDDVTYKLIKKDAEEGKYFLLVVFSETDKKSKNVISSAVTVGNAGEPTLANATLEVVAYDNAKNDLTATSTYVEDKNDVVVTFKDTINALTETIDTYTYELYKAPVTYDKKADKSALYEVVGAFTKVDGFEMVANETPNAAASDTLNYAGMVTEDDVEPGKYIYKVVKTNPKTKKYVLMTETITIAEVDDLTNVISMYATEAADVTYDKDTKTWVPAGKYAATQNNKFTVTMSNFIKMTDTDTNKTATGYVDLSKDVTLTLYRAETVSGQLSAVYTKVAELTEEKDEQTKAVVETYKYDADLNAEVVPNPDVVIGKVFSIVDSVPTTADVSYTYILVASKPDYKDVTVTIY